MLSTDGLQKKVEMISYGRVSGCTTINYQLIYTITRLARLPFLC